MSLVLVLLYILQGRIARVHSQFSTPFAPQVCAQASNILLFIDIIMILFHSQGRFARVDPPLPCAPSVTIRPAGPHLAPTVALPLRPARCTTGWAAPASPR